MLLEKAQEFNLERKRDFADFIQKQRAAVGDFKSALALGVRPGEGALLVAEEFAFQERLRDRAAIDGDERPVSASAPLVNGPRGHFLARPALPQQQNGGVGGGHLTNGLEDRPNSRAGTHHPFKGVAGNQILHLAEFDFQAGDVKAAPDHHLEFLHIGWLGQKVVGAGADSAQRDAFFTLAGNDNDLGEALHGGDLSKGGQPFVRIARQRRQAQIQEDDQGALGLKDRNRAGPVLGQDNVIVRGQTPLHLSANLLVVIDDQQFMLHLVSFWMGNNTRKTVPFFNSLSTSIRPPCASTIILL